ncbi:MAG TPA: ABC transporter substrate-binding protein [Woeseiaceae bacterium]|nr:ABC transporter substrate-binding protein [Woeseiaceae bacterium]
MTRQAAAAPLASLLALAAIVSSWPASPTLAADLTEAEERGKYIYETGRSRSRRVINVDLGNSEAPTPGHILPCINCHGADGRGAEDYVGVAPLNINWYALAASGPHVHAVRMHGPFDDITLARAIVFGTDPDGNKMEKAMPRYDMAKEDVEDLIAYLKVMDSQSDPAISGSAIRIGTVIPGDGRHAGLGLAIRETIEAVFAEVNASGGVNDRELQLAVGSWSDNNNPQIWAARDLVNKDPVAALVSPYVPNYDAELEALATETRTPVVGPYTVLQPDGDDEDDNRFTFYLLAGLELQARALVDAATARITPADTSLAIVYPRVRFFDELAAAAADQARTLGFASVSEEVFELNEFKAESTIVSLHEDTTGAVLFLGSAAELAQFARRADQAGWQPLLLSPGLLAERNIFELPESFNRNVLLAYPSLPTDYSPEGAEDFERLHEKYGFDYSYSIAQVNAYIAAKVLVEALERAGRDLTRDEIVKALESLDEFHPGLAPVLSYNEDRRTGSVGVHIVPVDLAEDRFTEPVRWIVPRETD